MDCYDIDLFFDQICETEPEEWFVLHMIGCKECRENFEFICWIRKVLKEMYDPAEGTGETLDESARHWMIWMPGDKPSIAAVVQ